MATGCQHLPDIEALLAPISDEQPCGEDLRYDTAFDAVQSAFQHCLRCEQGLIEDESHNRIQADWRVVIQRAEDMLARRTKDLRIAAWLARALASQDGFAGLASGLALLRRLLEQFWDGLYPLDPESESDTQEMRAAPLEALVTKDSGLLLPNLLHELPLVPSAGEERMSLNFRKRGMRPQRRAGEDESTYLERVSGAEERAKIFAQAVSDAEADVVAATYQDVKAALEAIDALNRAMHERLGSRSPGVSALRQAMEEVEAALRGIAREKGVFDVPAPESEADGQADELALTRIAVGILQQVDDNLVQSMCQPRRCLPPPGGGGPLPADPRPAQPRAPLVAENPLVEGPALRPVAKRNRARRQCAGPGLRDAGRERNRCRPKLGGGRIIKREPAARPAMCKPDDHE